MDFIQHKIAYNILVNNFIQYFELSQVGGYMNEFKMDDLVSCYSCDLYLPWPEINQLSETLGIPFIKAAWLFQNI